MQRRGLNAQDRFKSIILANIIVLGKIYLNEADSRDLLKELAKNGTNLGESIGNGGNWLVLINCFH